MLLRIGLLFPWLWLVTVVFAQDDCRKDLSSFGTQFMLGVIGTYRVDPTSVSVMITTRTTANVRVTVPFLNYDKHLLITKHSLVPIAPTITQRTNGTAFKGIELQSDSPISASVVVWGDYSNYETYLAIPVESLSTRYVAASYHPYTSYTPYSELLIVGVESNTDIDIILPEKYKTSIQYYGKESIQLQKFETYQFQGPLDVTGTVITSNKPIAVFSGSSCSQIPAGKGSCEYIVEQMVPTDKWDYQFIVPAVYPRSNYIIRVFTKEDSTEIKYSNSTHQFSVYLDNLAFMELLLGSEPTVVTANKPISIIQYGADDDAATGDPFMLTVPAISQYTSAYEYNTENVDTASTLVVLVKTSDLSGLLYDGDHAAVASAKQIAVASPMHDYTTVYIPTIYAQFHSITHNRHQPFGAVLYGLESEVAYGQMLPINFVDTECIEMAGNDTNSTNPSTGLGGQINYHPVGNGIQCFNCDDMTHLKYCDRVMECTAKDEVCYVQSYTKSANDQRFKSGCISNTKCTSTQGQGGCIECCQGSFCNNYGCGDAGLQSVQSRGPFCFDCRHLGDHDTCQTVQLCSSSQVCMIEQYIWGDLDNHYIMGCKDKQICSSSTSTSAALGRRSSVHTRNVPACSTCCNTDFCNKECVANPIEVIVG